MGANNLGSARRIRAVPGFICCALAAMIGHVSSHTLAQPDPASDPASEPAVLAVAKVLPAVVNINTERVVRRQVRDPFEDFAAQFFGNYRVASRARCARHCKASARVSWSIPQVTS